MDTLPLVLSLSNFPILYDTHTLFLVKQQLNMTTAATSTAATGFHDQKKWIILALHKEKCIHWLMVLSLSIPPILSETSTLVSLVTSSSTRHDHRHHTSAPKLLRFFCVRHGQQVHRHPNAAATSAVPV
jgi:hypothetical protein